MELALDLAERRLLTVVLVAARRRAVPGFLSPWLALLRVFGCSACQRSTCLRLLARNFFSTSFSFALAFGRQLPWSFLRFPLTGSYPGQQRFFFLAGIHG